MGYTFFGLNIQRRAVSFFIAQPTIVAHIIAYPTLYFFFQKKYKLAIIFSCALFITFSKGGFVVLLIGLYLNYIEKIRPKILAVTSVLIFLIASYFLINVVSSGFFYSSSRHASGLVAAINLVYTFPFGTGVGTAGNFTKLDDMSSNIEEIGESYFGAVISQTGIIGLTYYIFIMIFIYRNRHRKSTNYKTNYTLSIYLFATLCAGLTSESAISFVGFTPFALLYFNTNQSFSLNKYS